jgi:hypothetical protein
LEIYLRLLERTQQTGTPEAKKWYVEAHRLSLICRGPDDDFVTHCAEMLGGVARSEPARPELKHFSYR